MRAGNTIFGFSALGTEQRFIGRKIGVTEFTFTFQKPCPTSLTDIRGWGGRCAAFWARALFYLSATFGAIERFFRKLCIAVGA